MKKILIIILTIVSLMSYGQENTDCSKHTLYSDIWRLVCYGEGTVLNSRMFLPKESNAFPLVVGPYFKNNVDEKKIESYLLESLNSFRQDYGKPPVKESKWLTKVSDAYSKKLFNSFKHDTRKNLGPGVSEDIAHYDVRLFSLITEEDGDINKIIADSYFDIYIGSEAHTEMLLSDHKYFGFGITFSSSGTFMGVVRSSNSDKKR